MIERPISFEKPKTEYYKLTGGIDFINTPLTIKPNRVIACKNYEETIGVRGMRRIDGYERYDGQPLSEGLPWGATVLPDGATILPITTTPIDNILAVPGTGAVLGVWRYKGYVYAFRNHTDNLSAKMWKAGIFGWTEVVTPGLLPDGDYEFMNWNFKGSTDTYYMYWVDGVNEAHYFTGTTVTAIPTGAPSDNPTHIEAQVGRLFLTYNKGLVQYSGVDDPVTTWLSVYGAGAGELGIGEEIVNINSLQGDAVAIIGRNQIHILYCTGLPEDWTLTLHSRHNGALPNTVENIFGLFYIDDRAITRLQPTDQYGSFTTESLNKEVQPYITARLDQITKTIVNKEKSQYRVFFEDKTGVFITLDRERIVSATIVEYDHIVSCTCSSEDEDGQELLFFGSDNGFVYQMDKGTSFDGGVINAFIRLPYYHYKSPRNWKKFMRLSLEVNAINAPSVELNFYADYNYSNSDFGASRSQDITIYGNSGYFDVDHWDQFYWSDSYIGELIAYLDGVGVNMSMVINSSSATEESHTITGYVVDYTILGRKG